MPYIIVSLHNLPEYLQSGLLYYCICVKMYLFLITNYDFYVVCLTDRRKVGKDRSSLAPAKSVVKFKV